MSYETALQAAGAKVIEFKSFGSYQGDWYALAEYNGERGWIHGFFGSCSGCDAFEAEFDYDEKEHCDQHEYVNNPPPCAGCDEAKAKYDAKLAEFGRPYLEGMSKPDLLLAELDERAEWDDESREAATWIRSLATV